MRVRPIQLPEDEAALATLKARVRQASGFSALSEAKTLAIQNGSATGQVVEEASGPPLGFSVMIEATLAGEYGFEVVACDDRVAIGRLIDSTIAGARQSGAQALRWWVYDEVAAHVPPEFGFEIERALLMMDRPLPAESPTLADGFVVQAFRPGVDDGAWLAVNNSAFEGHPENGAWDHDDLVERMDTDWFSADGFRMAWAGSPSTGDLAGFCWTKVHPDGDGEIYVIAIAPAYQGVGLGRQLVLEGMRHLSEQGCTRVLLYTEAANEGAVALYRALGFVTQQTHRAFRLEL